MKQLKLVKIPFKFIFLIICLSLTQQACSMNNTEKQLSLEINSENLNYYINFNNIEIISAIGNAPNKQTVPINQWVINGKNSLLISVNLKDEDLANKLKTAKSNKLKVSLILTEYKDKKKYNYTISTFNLAPSTEKPDEIASSSTSNYRLNSSDTYDRNDNGDVIIGKWTSQDKEEWTRFTQSIDINLDLPDWAYLSADDLGNDQTLSDDDYYALLDEVYQTLENIWSLMSKKDLQALLKLTEIRSHDFDGAYYLTPGNKQKEMRESFNSAFTHKDLYLDELIEKNRAILNIEANGRLVRLDVQDVGGPMIFYSHKDEAFTRYYDFYFMKKDGKLIIVR